VGSSAFPAPQARESGDVVGIDVGTSRLIATSGGQAIGKDWRQISARVRRCRPGSAGKRRAYIARDHYIYNAVKQLPWQRLSAIGFEDLNGLKRGRSRRRGKNFRIAAARWTYRRARQRVEPCLASCHRSDKAPPEHVLLVVRTTGATTRRPVSLYRLRSHR
jgi:transposase